MSSNETTTCPNCGAGFSNTASKCPYCGALNPSGAEAAYMEQLEGLRQDTDDLDNEAMSDLKASVFSNGKSIIRVMLIVVIVIVLLVVLANCLDL
ncbi:MAG: hypothetical protein IJ111_04215 [Eggerthellaceae bacterium]|nr:hypothetical protein [Eggerthellaceae bacterium]